MKSEGIEELRDGVVDEGAKLCAISICRQVSETEAGCNFYGDMTERPYSEKNLKEKGEV
jgi:hypothetical protein